MTEIPACFKTLTFCHQSRLRWAFCRIAGNVVSYGARLAKAPARALAALRERVPSEVDAPITPASPTFISAAAAPASAVSPCLPTDSTVHQSSSPQGRAPMEHPTAFARLHLPADTLQGAQPSPANSSSATAHKTDEHMVLGPAISSPLDQMTDERTEGDLSLQDGDMASLLMGIHAHWDQQEQMPAEEAGVCDSLSSLKPPHAAPAFRSPTSPPVARSTPQQLAARTPGSHATASADLSPEQASSAILPVHDGMASTGAFSQPSSGRPGPRALANSGVRLLSRTAGAGVRTAGAGVRSAARFVSTPIAAARRRYFPIGKQYYIFPSAIAPVAAGEQGSACHWAL